MNKNEIFIEKAKRIHGDKYDYSKVEYVNCSTKVCIVCSKHGEFWQTPNKHLCGCGCPKCAGKGKNKEYFLEKAKEIHGDKYDYSKVEYVNWNTKVCIICPNHGEFWQSPEKHISQKHQCPKCSNRVKLTNDEFIDRAKQVHGDKYNYSKVKYINCDTKVCIICPKHGEFWMTPNAHLSQKQNCPKCNNHISKWELEINDYIKSINVEIDTNNREILDGKEIDILISSFNVGIECDGLIYHSELYNKDKNYHITKTNIAKEKNIQLIHIFEDEWLYKKEIVKSRLNNLFYKNEYKIYARKCQINIVSNKDVKIFLENNHIQGYVPSKINLGLYYNDELVSLMTFGNLRKCLGSDSKEQHYELLRFCNKLNTSVIGGASKLFNYFKKNFNPKEIISYCDLRWSNGNLYEVLGFNLSHISKPNYFYVNNGKRENRFNYRKDKLIEQGFDKNKTEHEIMLDRGYYRIYDCGCKVYKYIVNKC